MEASERTIESESDLAALVAAIEHSPAAAPLAVLALKAVRQGVITGEGPVSGRRVHFSRTIDAVDTAWVRRILMAAGPGPVTRAEAEALFDIHDAALERTDGGAFDRLLARAIAQHARAASGHRVPDRATALASDLGHWTTKAALSPEIAAWLAGRLRRRPRQSLAALAAFAGTDSAPVPCVAVDLAA
jgi:hypothetical protein